MSEENQKFQTLWDFRRRDDEFDSSSDDSKSISQCEPILKKHKLVSSFILTQEDEASDLPKNPQSNPNIGSSFEFGKGNRSNVKIGKKTRAIRKNKRKDNTSTKGNNQDSNCIDDLKTFAKSILEDLKIERQKMFAQMKEEMRNFEVVESVSKPSSKRGSGLRGKKASPVKKTGELGVRTSNSKNSHKVDEKVNHEPVTPDEKIPKPSLGNSSYSFHEIASLSHLNANDVNESLEPRKSRNGEDDNSCHFQQEEQFPTFGQAGSKELGFYDQQCFQTSNMNSRYLIPLHQRLDNGFRNIPKSQNIVENSTGGNILSGLRMNGSYSVANHFHGYMNPN